MNQIDHIINGLVAVLKDGGLGARYLIDAFPDDPKRFDSANAQIILLVQYVGSRYSSEISGGSQMRQANLALHLTIMNTAGANAHFEIAQIYSIVQGARIAGSQITVVRDAFTELTDVARKYVLEISTQFPAVPGAPTVPAPFLETYTQTEAN